MSFDARSRERLEALGRRLPQRLPPPAKAGSPADAGGAAPKPSEPRHRLETERNPEQLFRELMNASADGTVPPHLLERLRDLEGKARSSIPSGGAPRDGSAPGSPPSAGGRSESGGRSARTTITGRSRPPVQGEEADLYSAFHQLLLEDEEA